MDNNKTALTHRVTAIAAAYLTGLGCPLVETEVPVTPGWVADLATWCCPSRSIGKRLHLERLARQWLDIPVDDPFDHVFGGGPLTILVEVKTSRADFADRKWTLPRPAHICFVAYPQGIVHEVPSGWYGLETSADGKTFRKVIRHVATITPQHLGLTTDFIAAVGSRRANRTRGVALRAFHKAYNAKDREQQTQYRAARLLDNLAGWLRGDRIQAGQSLDELLEDAGIKKLPVYAKDAAEYFRELKRALDEQAAAAETD